MNFKAALVKAFNKLSQSENTGKVMDKTVTEGMPELIRRAASQGAVLLKNDGTLPFKKDGTVSLFGRVQQDWFYTGYGSGGDVVKPYAINLTEGIRNCERIKLNETLAGIYEKWCGENPIDHGVWGHWPRFYPEMPVDNSVVKNAADNSDYAVVVIGRSSGEDRENVLEKGSYYMTDDELALIRKVTSEFEKTVIVFNIGCMMDFGWMEEFGEKISAAMIVWQGGMESGNAVADLLSGKATPSGKLAATAVKKYEYYPCANDFGAKEYNNYTEDIYVGYRYFETFRKDEVLYPFGHGLSYTEFEKTFVSAEGTDDGFSFKYKVKNAGNYEGALAIQVYVEKPCGVLGNPYRELAGFSKTKVLAIGEEEELTIEISMRSLASYDESGKTGFRSAYVIEKGTYGFAVGEDVRSAETVYTYENAENTLYEQLSQVSAPKYAFSKIKAEKGENGYEIKKEAVYTSKTDLRKIISDNLPESVGMTGDKGIKLVDVKNGKASMEDFVAQLSLKELEAITRGDYTMRSKLGAPGNAGCFAGVLPSMRSKGIPAVTTTDGPSGLRLSASCSLIPIGTLLSSSFDTKLVEELLTAIGKEMLVKGSDIILAPGMNIHRTPLCGRNFEYFSEDPVLSGKIAAAYVRGIQKNGTSACPKHYACNNQEYNRCKNDSRLSERALREIYLRGFEICVKEAKPQNIMTSYNKINGVWGHYNYELCTTILRGEWGYEGNVMTDWWMQDSNSPEFPAMKNQAYRVRAQVDVLMPGGASRLPLRISDGTLLKTYGKEDGITLGEMQRSAMNVLRFAMNSPAMNRLNK